jgi:hypothetical protein
MNFLLLSDLRVLKVNCEVFDVSRYIQKKNYRFHVEF